MKNYKMYIPNSRNHLDSFGEVIILWNIILTIQLEYTPSISISILYSIINLILLFRNKTDIIQMQRGRAKIHKYNKNKSETLSNGQNMILTIKRTKHLMV